jgi:hypothetical protein
MKRVGCLAGSLFSIGTGVAAGLIAGVIPGVLVGVGIAMVFRVL